MLGYSASWLRRGVFQASDTGSNPVPSTNMVVSFSWLGCWPVTPESAKAVTGSSPVTTAMEALVAQLDKRNRLLTYGLWVRVPSGAQIWDVALMVESSGLLSRRL